MCAVPQGGRQISGQWGGIDWGGFILTHYIESEINETAREQVRVPNNIINS